MQDRFAISQIWTVLSSLLSFSGNHRSKDTQIGGTATSPQDQGLEPCVAWKGGYLCFLRASPKWGTGRNRVRQDLACRAECPITPEILHSPSDRRPKACCRIIASPTRGARRAFQPVMMNKCVVVRAAREQAVDSGMWVEPIARLWGSLPGTSSWCCDC